MSAIAARWNGKRAKIKLEKTPITTITSDELDIWRKSERGQRGKHAEQPTPTKRTLILKSKDEEWRPKKGMPPMHEDRIFSYLTR